MRTKRRESRACEIYIRGLVNSSLFCYVINCVNKRVVESRSDKIENGRASYTVFLFPFLFQDRLEETLGKVLLGSSFPFVRRRLFESFRYK